MKSLCLKEIEKINQKIDKYIDTNIEEVNIDDIDNIDDIEIDDSKPTEERIIDFINSSKNPYCFNINGCIVKFSYTNDGADSSKIITNAIKHILHK
jgi:hypothetical protein